jgi:hypothetical protein
MAMKREWRPAAKKERDWTADDYTRFEAKLTCGCVLPVSLSAKKQGDRLYCGVHKWQIILRIDERSASGHSFGGDIGGPCTSPP